MENRDKPLCPDTWKALFAWIVLLSVLVLGGLIIVRSFERKKWPESDERRTEEECHPPASEAEASCQELLPPLKILFWNVRNYLVEGNPSGEKPKKVSDRQDIAAVLAAQNADVIALAEMGGREGAEELSGRLSRLGLEYPYRELLMRGEGVRGLAVFSRFPITGRFSREDVPLSSEQSAYMMRGILDVEIQPGAEKTFRFIAVHLKSKYGEQEGNDTLRRAEASALRKHVDSIIAGQPHKPVVLCGDFNDNPASPSIRILHGEPGLRLHKPLDSRGESWTYKYEKEDVYSRIDYLVTYTGMDVKKDKNKKGGRILKANEFNSFIDDNSLILRSSDHRPIILKINQK